MININFKPAHLEMLPFFIQLSFAGCVTGDREAKRQYLDEEDMKGCSMSRRCFSLEV